MIAATVEGAFRRRPGLVGAWPAIGPPSPAWSWVMACLLQRAARCL